MVLLPFFYTLRALKVPVGTQEWLRLMQALVLDLPKCSLDRFYGIARSILVKSEAWFDAYDQAFLICFKDGIEGIDLSQEILDWLDRGLTGQSRPLLPDIDPLSLEELRKKLLERLREQKEEHHGGNYWIGTHGTSPFGHSGAHPSGIRIGGPGGGRMAVKVAEQRRFASYRHDLRLDTRQFKVALKRLREMEETGPAEELSIVDSIEQTCKNAGEIELVFRPSRKNQAELLLLMDIGGSMDVYSHWVEQLLSAAHASKHFKHFEHFYFHNCIYSKIYRDMDRNDFLPTERLFHQYNPHFYVMIVGDACMNPYELFYPNGNIDSWQTESEAGIVWLKRFKDHFPKTVWINPEPKDQWAFHPTIRGIEELLPMFPLTVEGLTTAIRHLKR